MTASHIYIPTCIHAFDDAMILSKMIKAYNIYNVTFTSFLEEKSSDVRFNIEFMMNNITVRFSTDMTAHLCVRPIILKRTGMTTKDVLAIVHMMLTDMLVYDIAGGDGVKVIFSDPAITEAKFKAFYKANKDAIVSSVSELVGKDLDFKTCMRILTAITIENRSGCQADPVEACTIQAAVEEAMHADEAYKKDMDEVERKADEMRREAQRRRDERKDQAVKIIAEIVGRMNASDRLAMTAARYIASDLALSVCAQSHNRT